MISQKVIATDFTLLDQYGNKRTLSEFRGKKVVLYFYPKDLTSGCTAQALNFKEEYEKYIDQNTVIIGISKDSVSSHLKFTKKYDLPFILLSDESLEVIKAYDVWHEKKLYGKSYMGVVRTTFIIDEDGYIIDRNDKPITKTNASDTLCKIKL